MTSSPGQREKGPYTDFIYTNNPVCFLGAIRSATYASFVVCSVSMVDIRVTRMCNDSSRRVQRADDIMVLHYSSDTCVKTLYRNSVDYTHFDPFNSTHECHLAGIPMCKYYRTPWSPSYIRSQTNANIKYKHIISMLLSVNALPYLARLNSRQHSAREIIVPKYVSCPGKMLSDNTIIYETLFTINGRNNNNNTNNCRTCIEIIIINDILLHEKYKQRNLMRNEI